VSHHEQLKIGEHLQVLKFQLTNNRCFIVLTQQSLLYYRQLNKNSSFR
jgi:hypothetical protein